ncbi:MAG: TetR/AcrR family transcriptional regulator [Myxococcota bacterium]
MRVVKPVPSPFKDRAKRASEVEEKRLAVLRTAAELFTTRGFHSTKLTDVAERLNITKPAIYHYFSSKDEILLACTRVAVDASERYFAEEDDASQDGRARLERFMVWFGESMATPFGQVLVRVAEQDLEDETVTQLQTAKRVIHRRLLALITVGIDDGSIPKCDAKVAAFTIGGALGWLGQWHRQGERLSAREASVRVTALLLEGLASTRGGS